MRSDASTPCPAPTAGSWGRGDLYAGLVTSLRVARRSVEVLLPAANPRPDTPIRPEKVACETALLLLAAARAEDRPGRPGTRAAAEVTDLVHAIARRLVRHARSAHTRMTIQLRPVVASELAVAHVCLTQLGYPDDTFSAELAGALASPVSRMRERLPWKEIERAWLGVRGVWAPPVSHRLVRRTNLGTGLDALLAGRKDIYDFTHALIYLTDFGQRLPRLPRSRAAIIADAEAALARCLDDDDFDLAGEVLLAWPYLRRPWSPAGAFGFRVLAEVERTAGFLPALDLSRQRYESLPAAERTVYAVSHGYHTAYVMGLLMAAALRPGCAPPLANPGRRPNNAAREAVMELMPPRKPTPQWQVLFDSQPAEAQDGLSDVVAAVALRRSLLAHDLGRFQSILDACCRHGAASSPAVRQGLALLARLCTSGRPVAAWR